MSTVSSQRGLRMQSAQDLCAGMHSHSNEQIWDHTCADTILGKYALYHAGGSEGEGHTC